MAIVVEASRVQVFNVQLSPAELCKTVCKGETLISMGTDEIKQMVESLELELNARENDNGNSQSTTQES